PLVTTHVYFIDGIMIDTGQKHMSREIGDLLTDRSVQNVLLTHHHEDHSGNAAMIKNFLKIQVFGNPLTIGKMKASFKILPYQHLFWGKSDSVDVLPLPEIIETENYHLKPIHTPGHSKDHTVFWEAEQGWLFSGDIYLGDRVKYFRADERIDDEIQSLKIVRELDFDSVFCGHHPKEKNGKRGIIRKLDFLENLYGKVEELHKQGLGIRQIMRKMKIRESYFTMLICFGNISARNMVKSIVDSLNEESGSSPSVKQ
ncbi:MAG: MBL fold metallo-hydrolase, partial [Deltaproteobacteria bacterium]|nr:MBL fold metallo-hydrolase [Deltaproteobacteria bacterium]